MQSRVLGGGGREGFRFLFFFNIVDKDERPTAFRLDVDLYGCMRIM